MKKMALNTGQWEERRIYICYFENITYTLGSSCKTLQHWDDQMTISQMNCVRNILSWTANSVSQTQQTNPVSYVLSGQTTFRGVEEGSAIHRQQNNTQSVKKSWIHVKEVS